MNKELKPALLTRVEIDYLLHQEKFSPDYAKAIRYRIREKLKSFYSLELPLILRSEVTANSHLVTISSHLLEKGFKPLILMKRARGDLNPGPTA
ncbi:MAG: hypothetical protein QXL52_05500 [Nitrososphaerales archaeon]